MAGSPPYQHRQQQNYPHPPYAPPYYDQSSYGQQPYDPNAFYNQQQPSQHYGGQHGQQHSPNGYYTQPYDSNNYPHASYPPQDQYGRGYPPAKRQRGLHHGGGRGRGAWQGSQPQPHADYHNQGYGSQSYGSNPSATTNSQYSQPYCAASPSQGWGNYQAGWQAPPIPQSQAYPTPTYQRPPYTSQQSYQHASPTPPYPTPPVPPPQLHQSPQHANAVWHPGQPSVSVSGHSFRPVPVSASSRQWRRPKTPPNEKKAHTPQTTTASSSTSNLPGSSIDTVPANVKASTTNVHKTASVSVAAPAPAPVLAPAQVRVKHESTTPALGDTPAQKVKPNPYPGLDFLGDEEDEWYETTDYVNRDHSLGFIEWRPPKFLHRALLSDHVDAEDLLKDFPSDTSSKAEISRYAQSINCDEQTKPISTTDYWTEMSNDPIFKDLSASGALVPFTRIRELRSRPALSLHQHEILQGRAPGDASANELRAALHQSHADPSVAGNNDHSDDGKPNDASNNLDEDDEPYSPPPAELASFSTPESHVKPNAHKRKFSALDTIPEEVSPTNGRDSPTQAGQTPSKISKTDDVDAVISRIEQKQSTTESIDDIQARIEVITNAKQIEAENQQAQEAGIQARIEAITSGKVPPPNPTNVQTSTLQRRRKSSSIEPQARPARSNSLPPKEFPRDESQEDLLAKLGVTGDAKPVFTMPAPARTEPPPGYERRSRSRSRSHSPIKTMSNGLLKSANDYHAPGILVPPPPPPPPPEPYEARGRPFERPSSALSQQTATASDLEDIPMESTESFVPLEIVTENETPRKPTKKRQRSESQDLDAATIERLQKRPPKVAAAYLRRW